jgi:pyruvate/2-oxoglutarate dehydrogenase complex dihydrolipoamide acyltransferase (E2) component
MLAAPPAASVDARIIATPYARRLARQAGVALAGIEGSGPNGRIKAADVLQAGAGRSMPPGGGPQPPARIAPADVALRAEPLNRRPAALSPAGPALSFAVADIDAGRLDDIERWLQRGGARRLDRAPGCDHTEALGAPSHHAANSSSASLAPTASRQWSAGRLRAALSDRATSVGRRRRDIVVDVRASMIRLLAPAVPPGRRGGDARRRTLCDRRRRRRVGAELARARYDAGGSSGGSGGAAR